MRRTRRVTLAKTGQLTALATELKSAIVDGIEDNGNVCTDGVPAYGGTADGEDFAGFEVYAINLGDGEADDFIETLPDIAFNGDYSVVEYCLDNNAIFQSNFLFEIRIPFHHHRTINGVVKHYSDLANWYLERLQYVLDHVILTSIMLAGRANFSSTTAGKVDDESEIIYMAQTMMQILYAEMGDVP